MKRFFSSGVFQRPRSVRQVSILVLPAGVWPVRTAAQLLEPHRSLFTRIRALAGVSADYWESLYQPLIDNFAAFVQQTPASEAHHHCGQGGMLIHSLQVMKLALEARKGKMLPSGAAAEEVNRQQHAWTFAIASAALLHDVGKPCSDQKLRLFDNNGQDTFAYWKPLDGALRNGCYRVEFVRNREYRTHELLPPLLARQLIPAAALSWLQQDFPNVFKAWLAYLSGQDEVAGILGQIVTAADMQSVADDLSGGQPIHTRQIPTARAKPLSQRLLTGLRHLLDENQFPLNRPGAAGFFDGGSLWLVSKRVLDELRTHLEKEGQTGIPSRNDRLMDELQQHGILTPTPAGQAIWRATVKTGGMEQAFTLLRLPASALWADPVMFPAVLDGSVTPEGETAPQPACTEETHPQSFPYQGREQEVVAPAPAESERPVSSPDKGRPGGVSSDDPGQHFLHWLSEGLRSGKHKLNETGAFLHVVHEGLLLVSPRIFKEFSPDAWEHTQKRFTKLGLHRKAPNDSNIWLYQVRGQRKSGVVRGFLLEEPLGKLGLAYLPSPNKSLSLPEGTDKNNHKEQTPA